MNEMFSLQPDPKRKYLVKKKKSSVCETEKKREEKKAKEIMVAKSGWYVFRIKDNILYDIYISWKARG